jgi:hypothetical protein
MAVLITYNTESGDDGVIGLYERAPENWGEQLAIIEEHMPDEIFDGCCYAVLSWEEIDVTDVRPIPEPSPNADEVESL